VRKAKAQPENTVDAILRAGQLVDGKYRVEHLLGQGGMAAVWAGTNERTGKRVALKVILRSLAKTIEAQGLFHSEVLAASRVNHPNVVTVFDVIEHEGMACIVMELLDGEPLGSYIAFRGFLTVSEATAVLLPAMRGVAAAHAQGVIHRDLKPQNIFICIGPDGRVVTTKVLDFGISVMVERVMDLSAGPDPALAMGTPAYMSPEQLLGWAHIDERADVYSFGVLLYEALTGEMAFPGQPGPELFHRIAKDPAPPVTLFRPELPPGLVRIIEKAMAKKPSDRYSNLNLMLGTIEDALAPATPAPRLLTPSAGVPAYALRESSSGRSNSVVQAVLNQEPSEQFQDTQLFIARPTEKDIPVVAMDGQADDGLKEGLQTAAPPLPTDPEKGASCLATWPTTAPVSSLRSHYVLRHWRWFVGAGCTIVPVFALWMAARSVGHDQHAAPARIVNTTPAMSKSSVPPTVSTVVPTATNPTVAVPTPLSALPSPPEPSTHATAEYRKSTRRVRDAPVAATPRRSRVAVRDNVALGRPAARGVLDRGMPALDPPQAPTDGASATSAQLAPPASSSAKSKLPRAGGLSADEF
jgi:serine/threonine protein kinase